MHWDISGKAVWTSTRRKAMIGFLTVALMTVCFLVSRSLTIGRVLKAEVSVTPYSVEIEAYTFEDNPNGEIFNRRVDARRSDGTTMFRDTLFGLVGYQAGETARKITFTDGSSLTLFDSIAMKATWPRLSTDAIRRMRAQLTNPPPDCLGPGETLLGYGEVLGERVAIVKGRPIDANEFTAWKAPRLGCKSLQHRIEAQQPDGSRKLVTLGRAVSLQVGEPDSSLFDEGVTYSEARPSESLRKVAQKLGLPWDDNLQKEGEHLDNRYSRGVAREGMGSASEGAAN